MVDQRRVSPVARMSILVAVWTSLYVISKIIYALHGQLGVTGGPEVAAEAYQAYAPGGVRAAQFGNAAVGALLLLLALTPLLPAARRLNRWILTIVLALAALLVGLGAILFLSRALFTDSGGWLFGIYCVAWCVLFVGLAGAHHRAAVPDDPAISGDGAEAESAGA